MNPPKPSLLENPVLRFTSATYKCEAPVRKLFRAGSTAIARGEDKIREGLRLALKNRIPTAQVYNWLIAENVRYPRKWAAQYDRLAMRPEVAKKIVEREITWNAGTREVTPPPPPRSREAIGREYLHKLAVWIVITGADTEITIAELRIEVEKVSAEKARTTVNV